MLVPLLIALTAWRLARVIAKDDFPPSAALRDRVAQWAGQGSALHYLVGCIPCAGVYTSGLIVVGTMATTSVEAPCLVWGASTALVVLLNTAERVADAAVTWLDPEPHE